MERLTNKKNATEEPTGRTAGFWPVACRYATLAGVSSDGTGRTLISRTVSWRKRRSNRPRIASGLLSTLFPRWPGAFGLTAPLISSISAGWIIRGLLWKRKLKSQRAQFIPKTFHVSWKRGSPPRARGGRPRREMGFGG